jgi:hypothetical protein
MSGLERAAVQWMRGHHAIATTEALAGCDVSPDQRRRLVQGGVLERLVDGAYSFAGIAPDELARCAAVCGSRPHLVVAGPTAGRLWGVRRSPRDGLVHVIAPPASKPCRAPWVKAYRTALLSADEIVRRTDGIRLTSPPRTVVDLTRYVSDSDLRSAIEDVLHRRICTAATLARIASRLDTPGRPWVRRFLRALGERHPGRAAESEWEIKVVDALVARGVADLERQVAVAIPGLGTVRFDAAVSSLRWAVEIDVHPIERGHAGGGWSRSSLAAAEPR